MLQHAMYCENGHRILFIDSDTGDEVVRYSDWPRFRVNAEDAAPPNPLLPKFCAECGAKTMSKCHHCGTYIEYKNSRPNYVPSYCTQCGQPFPWTSERLKEANQYTDELDLSIEEKTALKSSYPDLTRNTPKTEVAIDKFRRAIVKVGPQAADVIKSILVTIADEYAKRQLGWK